jgi:hypothetical protein
MGACPAQHSLDPCCLMHSSQLHMVRVAPPCGLVSIHLLPTSNCCHLTANSSFATEPSLASSLLATWLKVVF